MRIGYVYGGVYLQPSERPDYASYDALFGHISYYGIPITGNRDRFEATLWQLWKGKIGSWDTRGQGLGGWTLNIHQSYNPLGKVLYMGDGSRRSAQAARGQIITTVAGTGWGSGGDGGPATRAQLKRPYGVAMGSDGNLYIADTSNHRIRRVGTDGNITTVAGKIEQIGYFIGDGGPATQAQIGGYWDENAWQSHRGVAIGADGSIYLADSSNDRVRRIAPAFPGISLTDVLIPADDGSELYIFNSAGRHLRTLDALTGAVRYNFTYNRTWTK